MIRALRWSSAWTTCRLDFVVLFRLLVIIRRLLMPLSSTFHLELGDIGISRGQLHAGCRGPRPHGRRLRRSRAGRFLAGASQGRVYYVAQVDEHAQGTAGRIFGVE